VANCSVPPPLAILPLNVILGLEVVPPKAASALMLTVPLVIVVPPENVFAPVRVSVPAPTLIKANVPVSPTVESEMTPENAGGLELSLPIVSVTFVPLLLVMLPYPVSEPMLWLKPFRAQVAPAADGRRRRPESCRRRRRSRCRLDIRRAAVRVRAGEDQRPPPDSVRPIEPLSTMAELIVSVPEPNWLTIKS